MSRLLFTLIRLLPLQSQASEALFAQTLDGGLTWWALGQADNIDEANPLLSGLSGPEILAVKIGVTYAVRFTPAEICRPATVGLTVGGLRRHVLGDLGPGGRAWVGWTPSGHTPGVMALGCVGHWRRGRLREPLEWFWATPGTRPYP